MSVSLRGSATGLTGGTNTTLAFTLPTGHTTNDLLVALIGAKPYTVTVSSGTLTTDGWTQRSQGANGTTANGLDAGSVFASLWTKVHDGSESNPTGTLSATPSPRMSGMIAFQSTRTGSGWSLESTNGSDTSETGTSLSITGGANLTVAAGDELLVLVVHNTDAATHTSPSLTLSGATITNLTQQLATTTTNSGNDGAMFVYTADVTVGATAAPVFTATLPTGDSDGQAIFVRIREPQTITGTVTGELNPLDGTITGKEGAKGTVTGALNPLDGTIVGKEGAKGTVTGSFTLAGTTAGMKKSTGTVAGLITLDGTATGTKQEQSNDKTGTVTGALSLSGTVTGSRATSGTVAGALSVSGSTAGAKGATGATAGTITLNGTAEGTEGRTVAVAGQITLAGSATGTKATTGTVAGAVPLSGSVVGTKYDPDAPQPDAGPTGGGRNYYRLQSWDVPAPVVKTGRVSGSVTAPRGRVRGRYGVAGTVTGTCTIAGTLRGRRHARGRFFADAEARAHAHGQQTEPRDEEYLLLYAEVRRLRTENELLFTL